MDRITFSEALDDLLARYEDADRDMLIAELEDRVESLKEGQRQEDRRKETRSDT